MYQKTTTFKSLTLRSSSPEIETAIDLYKRGRSNPNEYKIILYEPFKSLGFKIAERINKYTNNPHAIISGMLFDTLTKSLITVEDLNFSNALRYEICIQQEYALIDHTADPMATYMAKFKREIAYKWKNNITPLRALVLCSILIENYQVISSGKEDFRKGCIIYANWLTKMKILSRGHMDLIKLLKNADIRS